MSDAAVELIPEVSKPCLRRPPELDMVNRGGFRGQYRDILGDSGEQL